MERDFAAAYARLNPSQKLAVDTLEGPVLVIAGPGTGKTQLLSLRIANILRHTDTLPENILCLTFTDSGAHTMRERLTSIIGKAAYDITISTYHAFGSELLRRYPEHFTESADLQPADDLTIDAIYRDILARLPYSNPLKYETFLRDVKQLISDSKRALLGPDDLQAIAATNQTFIATASKLAAKHLAPVIRIDKKSVAAFTALAAATAALAAPAQGHVISLGRLWQDSLEAALQHAQETGKTSELTKWKNSWLAKDETGQWIADGHEQNRRLKAAAAIYEQYLKRLQALGLYDYDDMILRAIRGLEQHPDLRYSLQERYLYLLLDEYQDTNEAQARLVELLTDNPVNEGRPNVLAVGDDDQAIYAFQGANYSHMLNFYEHYRDVLVVPLTQNYRSHSAILQTSQAIVEQIGSRLHHHFPAIDKTIRAANPDLPETAIVARYDFKSPLSQNAWIAKQVATLVSGGLPAGEIAILAPKHEYLEALVPFLQHETVPVHYDKRENVLDDPAVSQLLLMSRLVLALGEQNQALANSLWPQVLSLDIWQFSTSRLWELSWQANDEQADWTDVLCRSDDLKSTALFFIRLSQLAASESLEQVFDYLIGVTTVALQEEDLLSYRSPFYHYHFGALTEEKADTQAFWQLLSNLTVLRERLRDYRSPELAPLKLQDFIDFVEASQAANLKVLNTNPYQEAAEAVELMTAYKAKGQEFTAVFLLASIDEVWGTKARALGSRLSLPANLQFIRYAGTTEDERLRLLYVAMTRAKTQLYLTSYAATYSGKPTTRLKYLDEQTTETGEVHSPLLPAGQQQVQQPDTVAPTLDELTVYWQHRHYQALTQPTLQNLLQPRLQTYQLSPTQFNTFLNVRNDGPTTFLMQALLRFPSAPTASLEFGNAMHETLEWVHHYAKDHQALPTLPQAAAAFERRLTLKRVGEPQFSLLKQRGRDALAVYLKQRRHTIQATNYVEYGFRSEGVFVGSAHLTGKIDKLLVDHKAKKIIIVDYKTGSSHSRWERTPRLHFYRYQLYFYKFLVERSHSFRGYTVEDAYLEFVEPDSNGRIHELHTEFTPETMRRLEQLIERVWDHVIGFNFPGVGSYSLDMKGIDAFEADLLAGNI